MTSYTEKDTRVRRQQALTLAVGIADGRGYDDDQILQLAQRLERYIIGGDIGVKGSGSTHELDASDMPSSDHGMSLVWKRTRKLEEELTALRSQLAASREEVAMYRVRIANIDRALNGTLPK